MGIRITPGSPGSSVSIALANSGSQVQDLLVSGGLHVVGNTLGGITTFSTTYVDTITASSSGSNVRDLMVKENLQVVNDLTVGGNIVGNITDVTFGDISVSTITASASGSKVPDLNVLDTLTVGALNIGNNSYASNNYIINGNTPLLAIGKLDNAIKQVSGSINTTMLTNETLQTVTNRGSSTTNAITVSVSGSQLRSTQVYGNLSVSGSFTLGDLSTYTTTHLPAPKIITSTNPTYGNGTNTGLSVNLTPGVWKVDVNLAYQMQKNANGNYDILAWLEDGTSIIGDSYYHRDEMLIAKIPQLFCIAPTTLLLSVPTSVPYNTYTLYASSEQPPDELWVIGNSTSGSKIVSVRIR